MADDDRQRCEVCGCPADLLRTDAMRRYVAWKRRHPGDHGHRTSRRLQTSRKGRGKKL